VRVRLAAAAERDLHAIRDYLLRSAGAKVAGQTARRLREAALSLATLAERGNLPPELAALGERRFRELHEPPYRIIYHLEGETVLIDLVADARRDFRTLLEQRLLRPR
jgi:toxin ParE1/3/4